MRYDKQDGPQSYRWLIGHGIWTVGETVLMPNVDPSSAVLFLFHLCQPVLEKDERFVRDWKALHGDMKPPDHDRGRRRVVSRSTRFEEFGLIVSSLYRSGLIHAKEIKASGDDLLNEALDREDERGPVSSYGWEDGEGRGDGVLEDETEEEAGEEGFEEDEPLVF